MTRVLAAIAFLFLLLGAVPAYSVTISTSVSVTLAWDLSTSPTVSGYRVYYGVANGVYTNSVVVGNASRGTVSGLTSGVTAYSAGGLESDFSNGISYLVPGGLVTLRMGVAPNKQVLLTVTGQMGRIYDIQATQNFTNWLVIGTVTMGATGSLDFTDTNTADFASRFYRVQETP